MLALVAVGHLTFNAVAALVDKAASSLAGHQMAFVRTVELTHDLEANLFSGDGEYVWQLAVGYDDESESTTSLLVTLALLPGGMYDFAFAVVEADSVDTYQYWDGLETKTKIPNKDDRKTILVLICRAVVALVRQSKADRILCSTHSADLPSKALQKFEPIMDTFRQCDYNPVEQEPMHGRRAWIIERST